MKKLTKSEIQTRHLMNLGVLLGKDLTATKVVFSRLQMIERQGHMLAERYCNGEIDSDAYDLKINEIKAVLKILLPAEIFKNLYLNGDPRGYFLKLDDDYVRSKKTTIETDWGGYGIFCPKES